jgi:hypothetical protein
MKRDKRKEGIEEEKCAGETPVPVIFLYGW